jgi:hypothetical protein
MGRFAASISVAMDGDAIIFFLASQLAVFTRHLCPDGALSTHRQIAGVLVKMQSG